MVDHIQLRTNHIFFATDRQRKGTFSAERRFLLSHPPIPSRGTRPHLRVLQARSTALMRSNQAKDRVTIELREGSKILEDQLRLMDEKVQLSALDGRGGEVGGWWVGTPH